MQSLLATESVSERMSENLSQAELEQLAWLGDHKDKDRAPWVTEGNYTVEIVEKREKATERALLGQGPDGKPVPVTVRDVEAYFVIANVLATDNPSHPVGSQVCAYYSVKPSKYSQTGDTDGLRDLFVAWLKSKDVIPMSKTVKQVFEENPALGKKLVELYKMFTREPKLLAGTRLGLSCPAKRKKETGEISLDKKGKPYVHKNWRAIPGQSASTT